MTTKQLKAGYRADFLAQRQTRPRLSPEAYLDGRLKARSRAESAACEQLVREELRKTLERAIRPCPVPLHEQLDLPGLPAGLRREITYPDAHGRLVSIATLEATVAQVRAALAHREGLAARAARPLRQLLKFMERHGLPEDGTLAQHAAECSHAVAA